MVCPFVLLALSIMLQLATPARAEEAAQPADKTILFVCFHGSVKSQIAAARFNRIVRECGLPCSVIVDNSIPIRVRDRLNLDGLPPPDDVSRPLSPSEADGAVEVIASDDKGAVAEVNYWSDVPPSMKDCDASRDVIVHIDYLVTALTERPRSQETLQGVITSIDERNDRITLRLGRDVSADFKVQDGLLFNAVRDGDHVEITVETIEGAKTIVGLTEE